MCVSFFCVYFWVNMNKHGYTIKFNIVLPKSQQGIEFTAKKCYYKQKRGLTMNVEKRTIFKGIKLTESEWKEIQKAAKEADRKDAEFMRLAIMRYIDILKKSKDLI